MIKRGFDLIVSLIVGVVLLPLFLVIAILIRLKLGTPVIFSQLRPGLRGELFELKKFRTMTGARDDNGVLLPDEERLTAFGRLLRSLSLDELPEILNIIRGEMSFVGPRPLLPEYLPLYTEEQNRRHEARPGLTGWAQVNGRNEITWEERFEMDVWYVDHRSFWFDMKILWMTILAVITRRGVAAQDHVTMPRFRGSKPTD
ncbi:MAG: sugar transferase [Verrucomicrobiota bacterium]